MTVDDLKAYFGSSWTRMVGAAFEQPISSQSVYSWGKEGVPPLRQIQLEVMTEGGLKAEPGLIPDYRYVKNEKTGRFEKVPIGEYASKTA